MTGNDIVDVMPAEQAATLARWQMPVFDVPSSAVGTALNTAAHLDEVEAAAYAEGLQRGQADGYAEGQRAAQAETARLRALIEHIQRPLAHLDEEVERSLLDLACGIARRLVLAELQQSPEALLRVVREAMAVLPNYVRDVRLHVHPDDAEFLRERIAAPPEAQSFRVVPDAALARGDCRVITESSQLDLRLDTRLDVVRANLGGEMS
jgi:flagellar assembly protein FliH